MSMQTQITNKLQDAINLKHLDVINESHGHNVPAGSESHFKVIIVSDDFVDKSLIARHRMVNQVLADELQNHIHALALHTYTRAEWDKNQGEAPASPKCMGGAKQQVTLPN